MTLVTTDERAMPAGVRGEDRDYCRAALPRVSRTFAINIRVLRGGMAEAVRTAYLLCRTADALEDSWPGPPAAIGERFERLIAVVHGDALAAHSLAAEAGPLAAGRADLELVSHLPNLWRVFQSLPAADRAALTECVETMSRGMSRYATRAAARAAGAPYLDSESELHDYCWVVAGCVGVMLTRLFARRVGHEDGAVSARRLALAPRVGESLQLTNILLDWPVDVRRGRCYVPADWLAESALSPADLVGGAREEIPALAARLRKLARAALACVPDYLDTIPARHVRYRLFCLWPALWAAGSLEVAARDPEFPWGPRRPKLARSDVWRAMWSSLLADRNGSTLRRDAGAGAITR
jgi:farnesyl-diphosphate farnesyltransferase